VNASTHGLPCVQVNNPTHAGGAHIRSIDWRHLLNDQQRSEINRTIITTETPHSPTDPDCFEYPFPDAVNQQLAASYQRRAKEIGPSVLVAGRLGSFQYMDMDQAIAKALSMRGKVMSHSTAQWTGQPSFATQASLNQSAETKQLHQPGQLQQLATNAPVGQFVLEATTPASQPLYRASDCKSVSEQLAAEITAAVIHIIGAERPDAQCRYNIGAKITQIISRYNFREVDTK
jgi:hypothetical protein